MAKKKKQLKANIQNIENKPDDKPQTYVVFFDKQAEKDFWVHHQNSKPGINEDIRDIYKELQENPRTGKGTPEEKKYMPGRPWGRRLPGGHRILYYIDDENKIVRISTMRGHYPDDDKR